MLRPMGAVALSLLLVLTTTQHVPAAAERRWRVVERFTLLGKDGLDSEGLQEIVALRRDDVWVLGGGGGNGTRLGPVAYRWNGRSWRRYALPGYFTGTVTGAHASSPENMWVAGRSTHHAFVMHWNGRSWTAVRRWRDKHPAQLLAEPLTVATFGPEDIWVSGLAEGTVHYDGKHWRTFKDGAGITRAGVVSGRSIWGIQPARDQH